LISKEINNSPIFSIISPVYKAENLIPELVFRIESTMASVNLDYEIILVEDCGGDNSWQVIKNLCELKTNVIGVKLSRNFGQQCAIQAGLDLCKGDFAVVMDCDLQDRPEEILTLYNKAKQGFEIVVASRTNRQDSSLKKILSKVFNKTLSYLTDTEQDDTIANFFLINRLVIDSLKKINDYKRYYPLLLQWVGFSYTKVSIEHSSRGDHLESSYSLRKRINLAINTILTFSEKPLKLTVQLGVYISLITVLISTGLVIAYCADKVKVAGWTSLALLVSFFSGTVITILGMIGMYVGKIFESVKGRPTYIIKETKNE